MTKKIVIIGAGPAGEAAASALRRLEPNASVLEITVIEKDLAGGTCLNRGCIPSKTLLERVRERKLTGRPIDWEEIQALKNDVVGSIRTQIETRLKREKIDLVKGEAKFLSPSTIQISFGDKKEISSFDEAVIAIGTDIFFPPVLALHKKNLLTSDTILEIRTTPKSVLIVGGGAVGCEMAYLMNTAGSRVTLIEMKESLLPGEDANVTTLLATSFEKQGITVKAGTVVQSLTKTTTGWTIGLSNGESMDAEAVLSCVGRAAASNGLGLDAAKIDLDKGRIKVDSTLQTTNPHVWAIGDAAGTRLAHHASTQGEYVAAKILGKEKDLDERFVPRCLYSWPEVSSVGEWKHDLEAKNVPVKTSRAFFKGSPKAMAAGDTEGFVQIVSDPSSGKILGAQIIGPHATELIHIFSVALKAGMTTKDLGSVMFAHPTLAESIKEAARK